MEDEEARKTEDARQFLEMRKLYLKRETDKWCHPSACKEGDRLVLSFSRDMSVWQDLSKLILSDNNITDAGGETLAINLLQCPALNFIDLHDNKIGHRGAKAFQSLISSCSALTHLNLSGNPIDDLLIQAMATLLNHNKFLSEGFLAAAAVGNVRLMQDFMIRGASTRSRDAERNTALHLSALGGHAKAAEFLFENGLSFFSRNDAHKLPTELAELSENIEVKKCFSKAAREIVNTAVFKQLPSIRVPSAPPLTEPLPVLNEGQGLNSQPSAPVIGDQTQLILRERAKPPHIDFEKIKLSDKPIASGGMGVIYSGVLRHEGKEPQTVAVKMLVELQKNNEKLIAAIRNEYDILGTLYHSHVVDVIGYSTNRSGSFCLIMGFYSNGSLSEYLYSGDKWDSPWLWRLSCAEQVSQGLSFLHQRGLLHLDLTPENILLSDNWRAVIGDFGVSRPLQEEHTHCSTSTLLAGKAGFVAPETFLSADAGGKTQYSKPNDVYSLAILIWCCMSQQRPFEGWNSLRVMREVGDKQFRQKIPERTPLKLARLIERSWAHDAVLRPTAEEVSRELNQIYFEESARNSAKCTFPTRR